MLRRAILLLTLAAITAVVLALGAGTVPAAPKTAGVGETIECVAGKVCKGTPYDDLIIGSLGDDNIRPFAGNDVVYAGDGNDVVAHSYGQDLIEGGLGEDILRGGFDYDEIYENTKDSYEHPDENPVDVDHDLLDCAWLDSRGDTVPVGDYQDRGNGNSNDTVVDCSNRDDQ